MSGGIGLIARLRHRRQGNLTDLDIPIDFKFLKLKSKESFKRLSKLKASEYSFFKKDDRKARNTLKNGKFEVHRG